MCMGGGPTIVQRAPETVTPPPVAQPQDSGVIARQDQDRLRRAAAMGRNSTLLTGAQGVAAPATVGAKTLLGS